MKLKTKVDSAGRVVIPKELRARYGMEAGQTVSIVPLPDGVGIVPAITERRFVRRGRILTIDTGSGVGSLDDFDVDRVRTDHLSEKAR